jgi:hypothetical protein
MWLFTVRRAPASESAQHAVDRSHLAERDGKRHWAADGKGRANLDIPARETAMEGEGKKRNERERGGEREKDREGRSA